MRSPSAGCSLLSNFSPGRGDGEGGWLSTAGAASAQALPLDLETMTWGAVGLPCWPEDGMGGLSAP